VVLRGQTLGAGQQGEAERRGVRRRDSREPGDEVGSVGTSTRGDVGLDEIGCDAERLARRSESSVGDKAGLQRGDGRVRVAAAERAEGLGQCQIGRVRRRTGSVGQLSCSCEGSAGVVVQAAGGRLPCQHGDCVGDVDRIPQLVTQLCSLACVRERTCVVAEPGPAGSGEGKRGHENPDRASLPGDRQQVLSEGEDRCHVADEAGRQGEEHQRPGIVAKGRIRDLGDHPGHHGMDLTRLVGHRGRDGSDEVALETLHGIGAVRRERHPCRAVCDAR
jgi:hypothetical protein